MKADNFFANCDQSGGPDACWPYLGSCCSKGYGTIWVDGRVEATHRHAYRITSGAIPLGPNGKTLFVLHSCDNPPCCNPKHLFLGTSKRNAMDREERGRGRQPSGEQSGTSKLRTKDVIFIRRCRDLYNSEEMAGMLGVKRSVVCKILKGDLWASVTEQLKVA